MIEIKTLVGRDLDWDEILSVDDAYQEIIECFDERYFTYVSPPQPTRLQYNGGYEIGWSVAANVAGCSHSFKYYSRTDADKIFERLKSLIK